MNQDFKDLIKAVETGAISRREFMQRAAILGLAATGAAGLAGCGPGAAPSPTATPISGKVTVGGSSPTAAPAAAASPTAAAAAVKRGGTATHAINWTVPTMDPHLSSLPQHAIYENVYDGLVRLEMVDPKTWEHKVEGVLAESWEQKDAQTLIFKLRKGVKFHDGSDFDAESAKWNIERARDHPKGSIKASLADIAAVNVVDKHTIEIKTKNPNAALLRTLAFQNGGLVRMVSKAAFDKNGEEWLQRNPVGTGAFKFKQWISDDRVILDKNPDYWAKGADGKPLPYLDGLVLRYVPDPTVSLVDMRAGSVHFLEWVALKDVETVKGDSNLSMQEIAWNGQIYFMCGLNMWKKPFDNIKVRQAACYATDRVAMHKALGFGVGSPWNYPYWIKGTLGYDESVEKYEYNPAKVKQLLTEAGYPDGIEIELKVIAREPENTIGEFVQQMWSAVGIKTKLVSQERLSWIDAVRAKNFDACFWRGALYSIVDPELSRVLIGSGAPSNWQQYEDKEVDKMLDDGLKELDPKKREEIYRQMWKRIQDQAYGIAGFLAPMVDANRKELKGVGFSFAVPRFQEAWLG